MCLSLFSLGWLTVASGMFAATPLDRQIDALVRDAHESGKFSGSVLVTRGEKVIYERSVGQAEPARGVANGTDTRFLVGSVAKPFTAVLVLQLAEAGRLRPGDSLEKLFPNLRGKPAGRVTLHELLTHTSGLEEVSARYPQRRITPADLETAQVKPKAGFSYSSNGFVVLGLVVEAVTGRSYESVLREKILTPAGMKDSGLARTGAMVEGLAVGLRREKGKESPVPLGFAIEAFDGAGSLYTTPRDLWRFDRALAAGRLLSRAMRDAMLTPHVNDRHGYGWFLSEQGGRYYPWHKGDLPGWTAVFVRQVQRDETIAILANLQDADVDSLRLKILRLLKDNP